MATKRSVPSSSIVGSRNVEIPGIAKSNVEAWFVVAVPGVRPPLDFRLIEGGLSNLTFEVVDSEEHQWALRRPPLGPLLPTAHDMGREYRILAALGAGEVPVPSVVAFCDDEQVNERPFYVMEFVDGLVVRDQHEAEEWAVEDLVHLAESLADVLAEVHAVDPDRIGLGDLGRKDSYVERQLRRWQRQWESSSGRSVAAMNELFGRLVSGVPEQKDVAIVHGDYRLDNCIVGNDGDIRAVVDWELCTLGDPLADVGLTMVYWSNPDESVPRVLESPTQAPGFPNRSMLAERYAHATGRDLSNISYYMALGYWKLACILEGVRVRDDAGARGPEAARSDDLGEQIDQLAERALLVLTEQAS